MRDEIYLKRLGAKIVEIRKAKGITQLELAEQLGTKNTQVRRIETGKISTSITMLKRIAKELGVSLSELVNID